MYKHLFLYLLLFLCFLSSCKKVDELSDEASIVSFKITAATEGVVINNDSIRIENNEVIVPIAEGRQYFPLTISAEIGFSPTTDDAISTDDKPLNLNEFTFPDISSIQEFYLIAESGTPHITRIRLEDRLNAEILSFEINLPEEDAAVVLWNNTIRIILKRKVSWPITIRPVITKTANARFENYSEGDSFTFQSPADNTKELVLLSDNGDRKIWKIQIVPSIENSDFELWNNIGTKTVNIDPTPGKGFGWATANNSFVQGTQPVAHEGNGYAAQMTTGVQNLSAWGIGELITAGTLFTGYFKLNISALSNPPAMTYFGIPFVLKPRSIILQAKYEAGDKLQQSVKERGKYKIQDLSGADEGRVWVKLLHWAGKGELSYHEDKDPIPGLTIIGEGELIFDGSNTALKNWNNYTINIEYDDNYQDLDPTHIAIVMTSSRRGDTFIGAIGSKLTVDNVEVNY